MMKTNDGEPAGRMSMEEVAENARKMQGSIKELRSRTHEIDGEVLADTCVAMSRAVACILAGAPELAIPLLLRATNHLSEAAGLEVPS